MVDPRAHGAGRRHGRGGRGRRAAVLIALILGVVAFAISMTGVAIRLLPRQFTAGQQHQIMAWQVSGRWQSLPAGQIFPASVAYQLPATVLEEASPLKLNARRVSIAPQSGCARAMTSAAAGTMLRQNGCQAVLRATYVDATRSYVMTVGVAVLSSDTAAATADRGLSQARLAVARNADGAGRHAAGVQAGSYNGVTAQLYDYTRQISDSFAVGPYVVMYAVGYSDSRPRLPVSDDNYSETEMTSMAEGVAQSVAAKLDAAPATPHCPGAPGC
jgi:hypothetical protein